jgi:hypothetical protein
MSDGRPTRCNGSEAAVLASIAARLTGSIRSKPVGAQTGNERTDVAKGEDTRARCFHASTAAPLRTLRLAESRAQTVDAEPRAKLEGQCSGEALQRAVHSSERDAAGARGNTTPIVRRAAADECAVH